MPAQLVTIVPNNTIVEKENFKAEKNKFSFGITKAATFGSVIFLGACAVQTPVDTFIPFISDNDDSSYIKYIDYSFMGIGEQGVSMIIDLLKEENLNKIYNMSKFENDWNGNGAPSFSVKAINLFKEIITSLNKQPKIAPTGRNSLLMQYEMENKSLLAFEVLEDKVEEVFVPKGDYAKAEGHIYETNLIENINNCVEKYYGLN